MTKPHGDGNQHPKTHVQEADPFPANVSWGGETSRLGRPSNKARTTQRCSGQSCKFPREQSGLGQEQLETEI